MTAARVIIGTAGHVDHGKTALVRALGGHDTDRLPEEKARGMTIELGFAHVVILGRDFGVIDVPGHERFLRAMVAGASGVDLLLMVVAADEGVMPQTREHLAVGALLGVPRGVIALSKADKVEAAELHAATKIVRAAVRGTFLHDAPVVPVSARTGQGLDDLRAALARVAADAMPRPGDGPLRLPLDRVFSLKGFGTVVTGTLAGGRIERGADVVALPSGVRGKVRGVEVHGVARAHAEAGERTAVNLLGPARSDLSRGEIVVHPDELRATAIVDVELVDLGLAPTPLRHGAKVLFHALAAQANATVVSLAPSFAQIHLDRPMALLPGDRFVLRGFRTLPGWGTTLGGGRVLRAHTPKLRRADPEAWARLARMAGADPEARVALEVEALGLGGADRHDLRARLGLPTALIERALGAMLARGDAVAVASVPGEVVLTSALESLEARVLAAVRAHHVASPLPPGLGRATLRGRVGHGVPERVFDAALGRLVARGELRTDCNLVAGDLVAAVGFSPAAAETALDAVAARALAHYRQAALAPPAVREVAAAIDATEPDARVAVSILLRRGDLVRVRPELYFATPAIATLRERLVAHLEAHGSITPQAWKAMTGQSRKYAIPLAEHFDAEKLTLRAGDARVRRGR